MMNNFVTQDYMWMARAIRLAKKGRFTTSPNPNVGCVIVKKGCIVGEGFHFKAGEPHAEVHAMRMAVAKTKGATAYVTLEPCSHYGRTPPCAKGLIDAGIKRVVVAMVDPNPQVSGRGLKMLQDAGIEVLSGLMAQQAEAINPGFIKCMRTHKPYIQLKLAATLDGRIALSNGLSQWITGESARRDVQQYRATASAILSTSATVMADNPSLCVRYNELPESIKESYDEQYLRQPVRIIIDSKNRITPDFKLFSIPSPIILVRTQSANLSYPKHVTELLVASDQGYVNLGLMFEQLAQQGLQHIWVEAGATLAGVLLEKHWVDDFILYQAPKLIGQQGKAIVNWSEKTLMSQVPLLKIKEVSRIGEDIKLCLQVS